MQEQAQDPVVPNPTSAVNPSPESIAALAAAPDSGPIAMLNLLCFDGDVGRATYARYAVVAGQTIADVGGSLMHLGRAIDTDAWDSVALVYYPSRAAYLGMQNDDRYVAAIPDRTAGLRARLLYPFALPSITGKQAAVLAGDGPVAYQLLRWSLSSVEAADDDDLAAGSEIVRLPAGGPGLASDGPWHELRLHRGAVGQTSLGDDAQVGDGDATMTVFTEPMELA